MDGNSRETFNTAGTTGQVLLWHSRFGVNGPRQDWLELVGSGSKTTTKGTDRGHPRLASCWNGAGQGVAVKTDLQPVSEGARASGQGRAGTAGPRGAGGGCWKKLGSSARLQSSKERNTNGRIRLLSLPQPYYFPFLR